MRKGDDTNNHLETLQEADEEEDRSFAQERQPSDGLMQSLFDAGTRTDLKMPPEALEATGRKRVSFSVLTSSLNPPREKLSRDSDNAAPNVHANARQRSGLFSGFSFRSSGNTLDDNILRQSALRRTTGRANASANLGGGKQTISTAIQFGRRSAAVKASGTAANAAANAPIMQDQDKARATYRRYRVGDSVLVCNTQSRWANLVNRYGYPAGGGVTPEEQRGPYIYVLATVKKVHFEEDAEYYTVTRADTGADQRADAEWMEPLRTARGEAAALRAATESQAANTNARDPAGQFGGATATAQNSTNKCMEIIENGLCVIMVPFLWLADCFVKTVGDRVYKFGQSTMVNARRQAKLFLNGMKPYALAVRLTLVNMLVACSTWYMFIDQARLAFLPPASDYAVSIVSLIVWVVLVVELLLEVFIRPDGYKSLIFSDKAYAPTTVRFINSLHLFVEMVSLVLFVPEFVCLLSPDINCGERPLLSFFNAAYVAVIGPNRIHALVGRIYFALIRLRVFGLVRHWKKMWINSSFVGMRSTQGGLLSGVFAPPRNAKMIMPGLSTKKKGSDNTDAITRENALTNASNIGTALMVTNSHRTLMILCAIMGLFPIIGTCNEYGGTNRVAKEMTSQLQDMYSSFANATSADECDFLQQSLLSWVFGVNPSSRRSYSSESDVFLLYLSVDPVSCPGLSSTGGVVTTYACDYYEALLNNTKEIGTVEENCAIWGNVTATTPETELANKAKIRVGAIQEESITSQVDLSGGGAMTTVKVVAKFNQTLSVKLAAFASFLLQLCLLVCVLGGLSVLRRDSGLLVLGPLRRMLKIVARYAKNPLSTVKVDGKDDDDDDEDGSVGDRDNDYPEDKLGNYETEQLINAVSKITDLLRKCWGVAGADIISTNLATQEGALTEVFNPTVPGKSVYALFAFAAINGFDHTLRQLGGDVMILINDVAAVLHGEVFRWGYGDSGQCNKNLGSSFLMVFRIGLVKEVILKLEEATDVVFASSTSKKPVRRRNRNAKRAAAESSFSKLAISRTVVSDRKRKNSQRPNSNRAAMSLSLQSLPGISAFTDRAVIGMLKSFAGIYRDNKLLSWKNDFRLGAGVGAFSVNMIFGMDAGWAVEGAVGSEYKIDATYLSPHVNMAARMMTACKQFGVSILLSQAVQELMSETAKGKLRHLDTVTVKGSTLKQKIFTYDARHKGVDFFLFSRSDEQADVDSDRYASSIWNTDQDLCAMRQHVTEDFEEEFRKGRDAYLTGDWPRALKHLENANEIMVENVMDQGYIQDELNEYPDMEGMDTEEARVVEEELKRDTGDGPSRRLIAYIESENFQAPENWKGYRPLTSK